MATSVPRVVIEAGMKGMQREEVFEREVTRCREMVGLIEVKCVVCPARGMQCMLQGFLF